MPNQTGYIVRGVLMLLFGLATIKCFNFISTTEIIRSEEATEVKTSIDNPPKLPPTYFTGKKLFKNNCAACHHVFKALTGPALSGLDARHPDKQLLFDWIRNSARVLKSGNPYFDNLYIEYNRINMPGFPQFTDEEIQSILDYIKVEEKSAGSVP